MGNDFSLLESSSPIRWVLTLPSGEGLRYIC